MAVPDSNQRAGLGWLHVEIPEFTSHRTLQVDCRQMAFEGSRTVMMPADPDSPILARFERVAEPVFGSHRIKAEPKSFFCVAGVIFAAARYVPALVRQAVSSMARFIWRGLMAP
jgi:hypothetical protein